MQIVNIPIPDRKSDIILESICDRIIIKGLCLRKKKLRDKRKEKKRTSRK